MNCVPHAKVGDFGLSRLMPEEDEGILLTQNVGSAAYMAPEICSGSCDEHAGTRMYNLKADVFSYAILLNEILTETSPFKDKGISGPRIALAIAQGTRPSEAAIPGNAPAGLLNVMR